jgi:quercetin dioxygenase-like cupin family protein
MGRIQPFHIEKDRGEAIWFLGGLTYVKASSEMTAGAFSLLDQIIPPGFATPDHLHHLEDESFYLLEGEATFICAGKKIHAGPGDFLFGPREIPHGFRVEGQSPARMLLSTTPAGFERFVMEVGEPAASPILPEPAPPDMARLVALAAKYQIDILGPLPE